ncbi:uncharacterized protein LOC128276578 [Anopheles cruzii]|uniref:uncharacterized protein LOC128276578 n=1 Tax=Anopheles cruzii TaxID=68878 RepID=UPI0022EC6D4A|nr:uncharacterized protein LOC128276578 [Anopheles cruzii]
MQKIVFFGGTGMTGQCAVRYALKKGKPRLVPEFTANEPQAKFATDYDKSPAHSRSISKLDLGQFLVDCLFDDGHSRKVIGICTVK